MRGSQGSKGRKIARRGHTDGERRVVSYTRRHSRGDCGDTVIIYRSMPLRAERRWYKGIQNSHGKITFSQGFFSQGIM